MLSFKFTLQSDWVVDIIKKESVCNGYCTEEI